MGRGEPVTALPEIQMALLVEDFGPGALGAESGLDLLMIRQVLNVRDVFRLAGTKAQKQLTPAQWDLVMEIDDLAREEDASG